MRNLILALLSLTMVMGAIAQAQALPAGENSGCVIYRSSGKDTKFSEGQAVVWGRGNVFVCTSNGWKYWFNADSDEPIPPMPD
jgi:hypothetical protein